MSRRQIVTGLVLTMVLQLVLLGWMLLSVVLPIWTGTEIRVKTVPVDPRSLFRGNYARLSYEFSTLPKGSLNTDALRKNEPVFVSLRADDNNLYTFSNVSTSRPDAGVYLRGRLINPHSRRVRYGIEAWFAPKDKALQMEKDLRTGGVAVLKVSDSGKAALTDIVPGD